MTSVSYPMHTYRAHGAITCHTQCYLFTQSWHELSAERPGWRSNEHYWTPGSTIQCWQTVSDHLRPGVFLLRREFTVLLTAYNNLHSL